MRRDFDELANGATLEAGLQKSHNDEPNYGIPLNEFFHFGLSVDCVVFGFDGNDIKVLLIERGVAPYKHRWAIPGDLVYPNENLDNAAQRVLESLTGIREVFMQQIKSFGRVDRHPLGRVVTVAYIALIRIENYDTQPSSWADQTKWHKLDQIEALAFDHDEILEKAIEKLKVRVRREPLGFELLPNKFTLNDLQKLYEAVLNEKFDKGNFRKKILSMKLLKDLDEMQTNVSHRPARLYAFDPERYFELKQKGFSFEL